MSRYVVVGGGLAGLATANALAGSGRKVTLMEQSSRLGGRAITQQDRGYLFNLGPHALYKEGVAARTLSEWGVPFRGKSPDTSSASFFVYEGRKYPIFASTTGLLTTRLFSAREKWEAARILQQMVSGGAAEKESTQDWIAQRARSLRVRQFVSMFMRISSYTADLSQVSARASLTQFRLALKHGVLYLDGGWQTLVAGLERRALSLGVEIRLNAPVQSLDEVDADGIVLAVTPDAVQKITGRALPAVKPVHVACLDLGLRTLPRGSAKVAFGVDRPLYLSVHSAVARLAPPGAALAHLCKYLDGESDAAADRQELEQFADFNIPGWREQVEAVRYLPRMTVMGAAPSPHGRPAVDALGVPGLALAGDWVGPEGMLADTAFASALAAARSIQSRTAQAA